MSSLEVSTTPRMGRLVGRSLLIAIVISALIVAAFGPAGWTWLGRSIANAHPHAPRLDLLAAASTPIKIHLATVSAALVLATFQMIGPKGRTAHRIIGWALALLLLTTAVASLFIHDPRGGWINPFQVFSVWTLVSVPVALVAARAHNVRRHAGVMAGLYSGGMLFSGLLAFLPGRLMWQVFFG